MTTKNQELKLYSELVAYTKPEGLVEVFKDLIENHEYCKNSWFWTPSTNTWARRKKEEECSREVSLPLNFKGELIITQTLRQSNKHTYYEMYWELSEQNSNIDFEVFNLKSLKALLRLAEADVEQSNEKVS